jgi:hypothetical protein
MLDDHATDSNRKKMLGMATTLCAKYREALELSTQLGKHHTELTATFGQQAVERWEDEVSAAESLRLADVKVMDMYATQASALALALALASGSASSLVQSAVEEWIDFAIIFEQMQ